MKKYHLTYIRDGKYHSVFCEVSSIANFITNERGIYRPCHIVYSREVDINEWNDAFTNGLTKVF